MDIIALARTFPALAGAPLETWDPQRLINWMEGLPHSVGRERPEADILRFLFQVDGLEDLEYRHEDDDQEVRVAQHTLGPFSLLSALEELEDADFAALLGALVMVRTEERS